MRYARDRGMPIAVRGGGHDWAGRALLDDGLVIDMALMRRVDVDQARSVATLAGGATAADVVAAAEAHGLTAATGMVGEVGMVGLTLAGGYVSAQRRRRSGPRQPDRRGGRTRQWPRCHHKRASRTHLFWALRGGGALSPRCTCGWIPSRRLPPGQAAQADAAYGRNANRLRAIKRRWDPQNVFSATPLPARLRFGCRRGA